MSQNDMSLANADGATVRADINSALQALASLSVSATAPGTIYANQWWVDTTTNTIKQRNNANSAWIIRMSVDSARLEAKTGTFLVGDDDTEKVFWCTTAGYSVTFDAVATLGTNFHCWIKNDAASGDLTLDPDASETINGAATIVLGPGDDAHIFVNGSNLEAITSDDVTNRTNTWGKPQRYTNTAETSSSNVATIDVEAQPRSTLTLSENITTFTLSNIANLTDGDIVVIWLVQNGTGGYTIAGWGSDVDFGTLGEPTYDTAANTAMKLSFECHTVNSTKELRFMGAVGGFAN